MIILDTETTSLTAPEAAPIDQQPRIIEFAAIKLGPMRQGLQEVGRMEFLCDPRVPIPLESIKITGITNEMVKGKPPLVHFVPALANFFLGTKVVVAHNLSFDLTVLRHELQRLGRVTSFPWPPVQWCTVEKTMSIKGHRLNLGALYLEMTGKEHKDAHRAMADVEALVEIVRGLHKRKMLF